MNRGVGRGGSFPFSGGNWEEMLNANTIFSFSDRERRPGTELVRLMLKTKCPRTGVS